MKATIKREDLANSLKAISKIIGNPEKLYIEVGEDSFEVIANTEQFMSYGIDAENTSEGILAIGTNILKGIPGMRKTKLTLQKVSNTLKVKGGSDVKIYCSTLKKGELIKPKINSKFTKIKLKSDKLGIFKNIVKQISFGSLGIEDDLKDIPVLVKNSKNKLSIFIADSVHSVFYITKEKLFPMDFKFLTHLKSLKSIISLLEDDSTIYINDKDQKLYIKNSNMFVSLPSLQIGDKYIKNAIEFIENKTNFVEGKFIFSRDKFREILTSIGIIRDEGDTLKMNINGKKASLNIKTVYGESKDMIKLETNSLGNKNFSIPLVMFEDVLFSASAGDEIVFQLAGKGNVYQIDSRRKKLIVRCLAPIELNKGKK